MKTLTKLLVALLVVLVISGQSFAGLAWYLPFDQDMSESLTGDTPTKTNGTPTIAGSEGLAVGGAGDGDGGALDLRSNPYMGQSGPCLAYGNRDFTTSVFQSEVYGAQSLTYCGWFNTKDSTVPASRGARLSAFNVDTSFVAMMHGSTDGMMRQAINGDYVNSGSPAWDAMNEWVFFAMTYDSTAASEHVKWYVGGLDSSDVTLVGTADLDNENLVPLTSQRSDGGARRFVVGAADYFNGGSGFDGLIDELRMYTSKTDASGALGASDITEVKNLVVPEPTTLSLLAIAGAAMLRRRK